MKVLFVCLGNICRSPMAEAIMRNISVGYDIEVYSAGTAGYHNGEPAHRGTLKKLNDYNIDGSYLVSEQLREDDYLRYDYVIAMDNSNLKDIYKIFERHGSREEINKETVIRTLLDRDVPDPWYTNNFQETYDLCLMGCEKLLKEIKENHN